MEVLNLKKTLVTIFVVFALVLSSGVNALAFSGSDIKIHTRESVSGKFSDQAYSNIIQNIYSLSSNNSTISNYYNYLNNLPSQAFDYDNYILYRRNGYLHLLCFNGDSFVTITNSSLQNSVLSSDVELNWYTYLPTTNGSYSYLILDQNAQGSWSGSPTTSTISGSFYALYVGGLFISTNMTQYYFDETLMKNISTQNIYPNNLYNYPDVYSQLTDLNVDLPYVDGEGDIIDPTPVIESNSNHMYFKGCEIGFCEPYNQNNFSNYGGAYVYIRYQVDDWIVNHISDYSLDIQLLKVVGSNQETYSKSVLLDRDGCVEIPLSDFTRSGSAVPNSGFDVAVVNNIVEDNYYKSYLYCVQGDLANFVSKNSGVDVTSHTYNNPWGSLKDGVLSSIYFYQVTTETYNLMDNQALQAAIAARQTYNPYIFRIQVNLVSGEDRSGDVATKFDLVTGDQSDVSTSGFVNPDPFIPDASDPNFLPSVPGDNSTTPSTIVYTGGTFSGYFNGAIGFDPGYRELKQDLDADPDDNFTQYLAPFENNEVGGFVGDFLDDMPTAMKSIFIGGFGVLTLLGIYRFIRRG